MTVRIFAFACCIAISSAWAAPAAAAPGFPGNPAVSGLCAQATARRERLAGIPRGLLTAIARTESGRWNAAKARTRAWPWTVTVNGQGKFFATKAEAVADVEILLTKGITNVDVGCMQINMGHHWDAFETIDQAFDPAQNVAYAAKYLRKMREATRSWEAAAGRYHSATPELARRYRGKVMDAWREVRTAGGDAAEPATETAQAQTDQARTDSGTVSTEVDTAHMHELNAAFRARLDAGRQAEDGAGKGELRRKQIELWREARSSKAELDRLMAERKAELARKRNELLHKADRLYNRTGFAQRRRQQLDDWRKHFLPADDS